MWSVRNGRLYWGAEPVAVRRVIVERVMGRSGSPVTEEKVRLMLRLERAISILGLSESISRSEAP